ncbi:helix-turn-helix domain-containing protein [Streptomyces sp. NPDC048638]|uniref:helix-turn-helix domain-containing protein n=1 Tax=Streptomyces sp. NPDC048638 TaxID=3365580 RepID=UPI00371E49E3
MAEKQLSAAVRPRPRVRRSAARTGVTHIRHHQPDRYTIIGNHLAQHRELSLTAIGVGTHILSLPEGASVDIRTLAARFPEGRDRIAFALRELEAQGYIERVRERTPGGRVITRTYAHNDPAGRVRGVAADERVAPPPPPPSPSPSHSPSPEPVRVPSVPSVPPEPAAAPGSRTPPHGPAVALLAGLRRTDERLTLPERDVRRLAPGVTAWFVNGATAAAVHRTLTANLPAEVTNPAGLLAHRLRELLPPPLPADAAIPAGPGRGGGPRPHPLQTCEGCDRAFRALEPGRCRDCRDGRGDPAGEDAVLAA